MPEPSVRGPALLTLEITPLDVLFCGGGRPLAPASRRTSETPAPSVTTGALRTWLLRRADVDFARLGRAMRRGADFSAATADQGDAAARIGRLAFRGPWFAAGGERLVPMPATVHEDRAGGSAERRLCRFDPLARETSVPGWPSGTDGMRPLWRRAPAPTRRCRGYLRPGGLERFLAGRTPRAGDVVEAAAIYQLESRTGIGVNARRATAEPSLIYQIDALRLAPGVRLEVDILGTREDLAAVPDGGQAVALGGEGRRAIVRHRTTAKITSREGAGQPRRLVLLTTPGLFDDWRPPGLHLVSAAVPGSLPVSGWDLARGGPKRTRFAVPAGSVYFLAPDSATPASGVLAHGEDGRVGWGAFLEGGWNHA